MFASAGSMKGNELTGLPGLREIQRFSVLILMVFCLFFNIIGNSVLFLMKLQFGILMAHKKIDGSG